MNEQIEIANELYKIGVHRDVISSASELTVGQVKGYARRLGWKRAPELFQSGADFVAKYGETFAPFPKCPDYFVSSFGRILSMKASAPGVFLKPHADKDGYQHVTLTIDGRASPKRYAVHRMVLITFRGEPPTEDHVCAHGNGDRSGNWVGNLRWATQAENLEDKHRHGTAFVGSAHPRATIDEQTAAEIKELLRSGMTILAASKASGANFCVVADISREKTWRHVQ